MKKIDFLAIGDTVVDAFIKLKDAHVNCKIDKNACELCVPFGDKIPYDSLHVISAVGNSPNAAVAAARLGLSTALMTNIGDDLNGKECLAVLEKENIDTTFVKIEPGKLTNYHFVLWYDVDRTILIKHQNYERHWLNTKEASDLSCPTWIYLSSLGEDSLPFHSEISDYLKKHEDVKLAFQPGTFQIKFGTEALKDIYSKTDVFFCNKEEAEKILNIESKDILTLSKGIQELGPKIVVISDGSNGAYLYIDRELWHNEIYPDIAPPVDRTGAGDAFSSTFTSALCLGKTPLEAFSWGPINSMSVVQKIGAQEGLLSREKLEEYLKIAPNDYKVNKIK
ncbi:MAG: Sugar kinase, ribokinase family [Candidatus Nomurabacteria bacterium GW2011_GWE1_32_28]|uniref:Sugar kinase, ribokinase family n=1 Tax=Candidatus Nomurabacteria bacterium GW2011_GWF1_31_48 TaxID=1618767 RepID=A0A0F9YEM9_9BACT|nr:MAG: Sugar kinase, ribokinase family [Candidatus Nomurabacteria bacterium GW2011_GWF2_30_133]KKP28519.1 MAG: Sugar kinase, ribokinase family [Candidatus Nomurabacteria bacterium GW2011_GWE2_31_40]KKP30114.1 MAG: Sugar kinase, ribokinase family [Candidatus Nomurabacteria bacterium GW2011_GWF1_31_48]KKP34659.1 MAG: Sugar kinase, ribokinase family [Candidatus Nomurabacteria bacterium GW2011_GWE1_32_28]